MHRDKLILVLVLLGIFGVPENAPIHASKRAVNASVENHGISESGQVQSIYNL